MSQEAFEQRAESGESAFTLRREYRCRLKNTRDHKVRVYFLKCTHAEEIHVLNANQHRTIDLLEGLVVVVAFDVERCEFIVGRVLNINGSQEIVI
jgi:hypothetical protein